MEQENSTVQQAQKPQQQNKRLNIERQQMYLTIMSDPSLLLYHSMTEGKNELTYKTKLFYSIGVSKDASTKDDQKA